MEWDLKLISGEFMHLDLRTDQKYLLLYFPYEYQRVFLGYYMVFQELYEDNHSLFARLFCAHTGFKCQRRWVRDMVTRIRRIENAMKEAQGNLDFDTVSLLRSGKLEI
jgi:hypothetical protein